MKQPITTLLSFILISLFFTACIRETPPLIVSSTTGDIKSVKTLLSKGANVNERNFKGDTALILASREGQLSIVQELIANGADVNGANKYGHTALILATENGYIEIVEKLIVNGADLDAQVGNPGGGFLSGLTALNFACFNNYSDIAEMLISNGANVNLASPYLPLEISARKGNTRIVNALISEGADVNATYGVPISTALMSASNYGHIEVVKTLIRNGADVNLKPTTGKTALYLAISNGYVDVVRELLAHGAEVNILARSYEPVLNLCSDTPLERSKLEKHTEITELLEDAGATAREVFTQDTLNDFAMMNIGYLDQSKNKFIVPLTITTCDNNTRKDDLILGKTTAELVKRKFFNRLGGSTNQMLGIASQVIKNAKYMAFLPDCLSEPQLFFDHDRKLIVLRIRLDTLQVYVPCQEVQKIIDIKQETIRTWMRKYQFTEAGRNSMVVTMRANISPCVVVDVGFYLKDVGIYLKNANQIRYIDYMYSCQTR